MKGTLFWLGTTVALALTAFATRVSHAVGAGRPTREIAAVWVVSFVLYAAAIARAARRLPPLSADQAVDEWLRVTGLGFLLVFFSLEMP